MKKKKAALKYTLHCAWKQDLKTLSFVTRGEWGEEGGRAKEKKQCF